MKKEEFDEMFDKAFEEAVKQHSFVPDSEESWKRVEKKLSQKHKRRARLKLLPFIAASFLLGALIFGTPTATEAFNPFIKAVTSITDDVVSIVFGTGDKKDTKALTPPPPGLEEGGGKVEPSQSDETFLILTLDSWESVKEIITFPVPNINDFMKEFEFSGAEISQETNSGETSVVILNYNYHSESVRLFFRQLSSDDQVFSNSKRDNSQYEHLNIYGNDVFYFKDVSEKINMELVYNDRIQLTLIGALSHQQMVELAEYIFQQFK